MHLNDAILAKTGGPTVQQGMLAYYLANGATSLDLNDAEREYLLANGAGIVAGPELITDPSFASPSSWTAGIGWTVIAGSALIDGSNTAKSIISSKTAIQIDNGKTYSIALGLLGCQSGEVEVGIGAIRTASIFNSDGITVKHRTASSSVTGVPLLEAVPGTIMQVNFFSIAEEVSGNAEYHINNLWEYYLRVVKGYTGSLDDMKLKFWSAP